MTSREAMVQKAIDMIDKKYGAGSIRQLGTDPIPGVESVSTGAITLDDALGIGGVPRGRITEIYGPESSGKTTLALHIIANVQRAGGSVAIIDTEHAVDLGYAQRLGVDVSSLLVSQPDSGEQALEIAETLVRSGVNCVVVDSVAMLIPEAELRGEMSDLQVGAQARLMSKGLRKLTAPIEESGCVFIFINQIRTNIGSYGSPETTPGGRALKFAASIRLDLRKKDTVRDGQQTIGIHVLAKVAKNKLADPHRTAEFDIYFGKGIDTVRSLLDAAQQNEVVRKSGTWLYYGDIRLGQGTERALEYLREHPEVMTEIRSKCA